MASDRPQRWKAQRALKARWRTLVWTGRYECLLLAFRLVFLCPYFPEESLAFCWMWFMGCTRRGGSVRFKIHTARWFLPMNKQPNKTPSPSDAALFFLPYLQKALYIYLLQSLGSSARFLLIYREPITADGGTTIQWQRGRSQSAELFGLFIHGRAQHQRKQPWIMECSYMKD